MQINQLKQQYKISKLLKCFNKNWIMTFTKSCWAEMESLLVGHAFDEAIKKAGKKIQTKIFLEVIKKLLGWPRLVRQDLREKKKERWADILWDKFHMEAFADSWTRGWNSSEASWWWGPGGSRALVSSVGLEGREFSGDARPLGLEGPGLRQRKPKAISPIFVLHPQRNCQILICSDQNAV